jgi:L-threonylcarbamoyladenylate synthase
VTTDLIEINPDDPSEEALELAAKTIRAGEVIAAPTDALYSLLADPFSLRAVQRVYSAKGRENTRSLPLMVADFMMGEELASEINSRYYVLTRKFWPGALTVIVPAAARVPLKVTGNTGRLALRQSKSTVVEKLIEKLGHPLIATSANISGEPTCRTGIEVFGTMDGRLPLILDGGSCPGSGPTTVDITEPYWKVIREGDISEKEIAETLKP